MLEKYCSDCHNATDWAGGVAFDTMRPESIAADAKVWEEAVRKLRGGLMPPPGEPQPDAATSKQFVSWMEARLDERAADNPDPGYVALHRLNRTEYARAVESILGVQVDPATLLPKETKSDGFDNVAECCASRPHSSTSTSPPRAPSASRRWATPTRAPSARTYRAAGGRKLRTAKACRWARAAACWWSTGFLPTVSTRSRCASASVAATASASATDASSSRSMASA